VVKIYRMECWRLRDRTVGTPFSMHLLLSTEKKKKKKKFNHAKFVHIEIGHCNIHFNPYFEE
jgi:hypothetical protein